MTREQYTRKLGTVPHDWEVRPLGEITERTGLSVVPEPAELYREIGIRSHGKGLFHKEPVAGATLGAKRVFAIEPERLVFNIVFAWEGAVAVTTAAERGMIASHRFPMLRPIADRAHVEFLRRFFQTAVGVRLLGEASPGGAGRNRTLGQKLLAEIPVPVPPLGEQRKIAAILSSVDDAIEATQAVIEQLQVVKKAMMAELLTRGLPGRHTRFKNTEVGEIPEEWEVVPLLDVVRLPSGQVDPRVAPYSSMPLIAPNHIESHSGRLLAIETAQAQGAISGKYEFAEGDVIYSKIRPYLRKAWIADRPGICSADMYPMRSERVVPAFLFLILMSERFSEFTASLSMRTGIPKINREELSQFLVPLPTRGEQEAVAEIHQAAAERDVAEHEKLAVLADLKSALMSVLLTGELRVTPEDEAT